jgi:hypothetical protein
MNKYLIALLIINTIAILFLCWNAYMNSTQMIHMWEMFQEFERLLIELLTGRLPTDEA